MAHLEDVADLDELLALEPCADDAWRSVAPDSNYGGEVFGGQYLGLSIKAAMLSAPGRMPHAITCYFLRSARASEPVVYHVEHTRDGRGFAHRRVAAMQNGKEAFRAEVSFHEWEDGQPCHASPAPHVEPAEKLRTLHELVVARQDSLDLVTVRRIINRGAFHSHFVDPEAGLGRAGERPETIAWVRPNPPVRSADPLIYFPTLAYISDACANFASRTVHSPNLYDGQMLSVSLNHAIWFHAPPRPFERVLYSLDSPFAGGGLGYNRGTMFDTEGQVLASVVQEALIRRRPAEES
jgi:acyl-CoA thioesterase II